MPCIPVRRGGPHHRWITSVLALLLTLPPAMGCRAPERSRPDVATVVRVVDGDTVVLDVGGHDETVRLLGIDTPETVKPNAPVECFGPEASDRLKELIPPGSEVRVERDAEIRDRYGRLLLFVFRLSDRRLVNRLMIDGGFARALTIAPNRARAGELSDAARVARSERRGLWGHCPSEGAGS